MAIERFVRFVDASGAKLYGEPTAADVKGNLEGKTVTVLAGDPYTGFQSTSEKAVIKQVRSPTPLRILLIWKLLSPIESTPIFQCIGLNYAHHAKEAGVCLPNPSITSADIHSYKSLRTPLYSPSQPTPSPARTTISTSTQKPNRNSTTKESSALSLARMGRTSLKITHWIMSSDTR